MISLMNKLLSINNVCLLTDKEKSPPVKIILSFILFISSTLVENLLHKKEVNPTLCTPHRLTLLQFEYLKRLKRLFAFCLMI